MYQTQSRQISIPVDRCLYQFTLKSHFDPMNKLTVDQWEDFVDKYQSAFAQETSAIAKDMLLEYLQQL